MAAPYHIACGYERRIEPEDPGVVQSVCTVCGRVIVGSVLDHLREDEAEHRVHCPMLGSEQQSSAKSGK